MRDVRIVDDRPDTSHGWRGELDLEALRRFANEELSLARLGRSQLASVDADDIVDAVLLDDWSRWGRSDGPLPTRLLNEVRSRIDLAAETWSQSASEDLEEDWVRDNSAFWPDADRISFEEQIGDGGPDPQQIAELFEELSPSERRAILLSRCERRSVAEIAAALHTDCAEAEGLLESAAEKLAHAYLAS